MDKGDVIFINQVNARVKVFSFRLPTFQKKANEFTNQFEIKMVLIGDESVSQLMVEYNLGVAIQDVYELKNLDMDFLPARYKCCFN